MQEVTIKRSPDIKLAADLKTFLNPKFIFVPVDECSNITVRDGEYVYKNDVIAKDNSGHVVTTSISGKVLGLKRADYFGKTGVLSVVIENDFKENTRLRKSANKYIFDQTKESFLHILKDTSHCYKKVYSYKKFEGKADTIILNGVEQDPNFGNKEYLLSNYLEEILEIGDFLGDIMEAGSIKFIVKNTASELIGRLTGMLGMYPSIELKLMSDAYPNGHAEVQKKFINCKDALVVEIEEALELFQILKRERVPSTRLITVTGDGVSRPAVVRVKKGTLLSEVFVHNFDFGKKNIDVYINGNLYGSKSGTLKYIIDDAIDGVLIVEKSDTKEEACLNCGQCSKTCPMRLNPKYVFDHKGNVTNEYLDGCLQCGLCNYVCPANRDLKSFMKGCDQS